MQGVVIRELKTAECTVVKGKPDQAQQAPDRVQAHGIDLVPFPEPAKFEIVAFGTISVPLKKSEEGPIVIAVRAAMRTAKRGSAKDALEEIPASALVHPATGYTARSETSEKQGNCPIMTNRMCEA
jgi:hypothetical protein